MLGAISMLAAAQDHSAGHASGHASGLASRLYAEIVNKAAAAGFNRVTVLYLDPRIMTRVAVTPQALAQLGCRLEIRSDSPKWADLVAILRSQSVTAADRPAGEVRWGMTFHDDSSRADVQDLYFGPYYGPQMDGLAVFGYLGKLPVYFPAALPKKMTAYIQGLGC